MGVEGTFGALRVYRVACKIFTPLAPLARMPPWVPTEPLENPHERWPAVATLLGTALAFTPLKQDNPLAD